MRQAGVLAAAGLYALDHNVDRLAEDHANAALLAKGLAEAGLKVDPVQTNMVFATIPADSVAPLARHLEAQGIKTLTSARLRLVTHLDVDRAQVERAIEVFAAFFKVRTATAAD